jgi:hypothetical protein
LRSGVFRFKASLQSLAIKLILLDAVLLVELINTAAGVDQFLLAGIERMALGADLNGDVLLGGAGLDDRAASASDGGLLVIRMNSFLHCFSLLILGCLDCAAWHSYKTQNEL